MKYTLIDFPKAVAEAAYQEELLAMAQRLMATGVAKAVYQLGGVSAPGISDLDMLAVFEDGANVNRNFLSGISETGHYLFIHNIYGTSQSEFAKLEPFVFYHHYRLLAGTDVRKNLSVKAEDMLNLKTQVAMEFLVKMHVTLFMQETYGVLRIRDLLLHVKALMYDLEFLNINSGHVYKLIQQIISWRTEWFARQPEKHELIRWWNDFYEAFDEMLRNVFQSQTFYLPHAGGYHIARNIMLHSGRSLAARHTGLILPQFLSAMGKKFFRLQNRLNEFHIEVPATTEGFPEIIKEKFIRKKMAWNTT